MPRILRWFVGAMTAAAVACFASPAGAALWHSGFDPVTFSGNALFQFDDACQTGGTATASSCNLTLLNATVNLNGAGGSSALLNFGPHAIQGQPGAHVSPGEIFTFQLTEVGGATPGATILLNVTVGSPVGGGLDAIQDFSVVAVNGACNPCSTLTTNSSNLLFDPTNLDLSGDVTGTFIGTHGGLHSFDLSFGAGGAWTLTDTKPSGTTISQGGSATVPALDIIGTTLVSIDSSLIGPALVSDPASPLFGPWWLQWQTVAGPGGSIEDEVLLFTGTCGTLDCVDQSSTSGVAANVTFAFVPPTSGADEPATVALLGIALAGLAFSRRKRKD